MRRRYLTFPLTRSPLFLLLGCAFVVAITSCAKRTPVTMPPTTPPAVSNYSESEPTDVSLIQLIANPEKYQGKFVRVIGYVHLEFEGNAIYLHQEDYTRHLSRNGLWLDICDRIRSERHKYSDRYCLIEGTFNALEHGHMSLASGAMQNIKRFD